MVSNITCFKIPGSGFIFVASEYPSMTNKEIIQYILFRCPCPCFVFLSGLSCTIYICIWLPFLPYA